MATASFIAFLHLNKCFGWLLAFWLLLCACSAVYGKVLSFRVWISRFICHLYSCELLLVLAIHYVFVAMFICSSVPYYCTNPVLFVVIKTSICYSMLTTFEVYKLFVLLPSGWPFTEPCVTDKRLIMYTVFTFISSEAFLCSKLCNKIRSIASRQMFTYLHTSTNPVKA